MTRTAYVTHQDYRLHTLDGHPEHAGRIEAIWALLEEKAVLGELLHVDPAPASVEQLSRVHTARYIDLIERAAQEGGGMLDADTYLLPVSYDVACLSAGGALAAVDAVLGGQADNALAVVRPPGHHATPNRGMGFCLFNNIALAARHAQAAYEEVERVLIVDYDVHHGNGTQDAFYQDKSVLYVSTHQYPYYPGSGALGDIGSGPGRGATINMPLRAGTGNEGFELLYERVLWPAARRFRPDLILVSAGFDAHWADPLAMLQLDLRGYAHLTRELIGMAGELCAGRAIFVLEGGYDLEVLSHGVLNVVYALLGQDIVTDPLGEVGMPGQPTDDLVAALLDLHQLG
ncbi:MAG: histone deacetylase [Chloroflexota bacterium]